MTTVVNRLKTGQTYEENTHYYFCGSGVYFAFSNTIDEFLYPEKRPGLNTYDTYTTTTQQTTTTVTQQTPIVTDEDGYEPRDDRKPDYVQPADPTWSKRTFNWTSYDKQYTFEISMNIIIVF